MLYKEREESSEAYLRITRHISPSRFNSGFPNRNWSKTFHFFSFLVSIRRRKYLWFIQASKKRKERRRLNWHENEPRLWSNWRTVKIDKRNEGEEKRKKNTKVEIQFTFNCGETNRQTNMSISISHWKMEREKGKNTFKINRFSGSEKRNWSNICLFCLHFFVWVYLASKNLLKRTTQFVFQAKTCNLNKLRPSSKYLAILVIINYNLKTRDRKIVYC